MFAAEPTDGGVQVPVPCRAETMKRTSKYSILICVQQFLLPESVLVQYILDRYEVES
jgi:hypothetical protein